MVNVKKLLTKVLEYLTPASSFMSIAPDSGFPEVDEFSFAKCGNLMMVTLGVHRTSSTAVGANIFAGTLGGSQGSELRPRFLVNGCGYSGSTCGVAQFTNNGRFVVRCTGAALPENQTMYVSVIYMI